MLPILHLNGYKISGPTVLGRDDDGDVRKLLEAHGYDVTFVEEPRSDAARRGRTRRRRTTMRCRCTCAFAQALDGAHERIRAIQDAARARSGAGARPRWPAIVLRTPKGWTGPRVVDGTPVEGTFRAHQVPLANVAQQRRAPADARPLDAQLPARRAVRCQTAASCRISPRSRRAAIAAWARTRMRTAAGSPSISELPDFREYGIAVPKPATERHESTRRLGQWMRDIFKNRNNAFRLFCPDETNSNRLGDVFTVENRCSTGTILPGDDHLAPDGRVMEVLSEHLCQGWLEGYLLTGRHGLFATYEAFAMVSASMTVQHTKWLEEALKLAWRAPIPSLNILLTSTCWRNDHNGFSHQGPGLIDTVLTMKGAVARIYLPPDANCLLSVADHCLRSRNYVNLIVIDKQPELQWLDMDAAVKHCAAGRVDLELGQQRDPRQRARRGAGGGGRHADPGDRRGGVAAAQAPAGAEGARGQRRRPHVPGARPTFTRTACPRTGSCSCSPPIARWSSASTAISARCTRSCTAARARSGFTCAASWRRGRPPRPSTWW